MVCLYIWMFKYHCSEASDYLVIWYSFFNAWYHNFSSYSLFRQIIMAINSRSAYYSVYFTMELLRSADVSISQYEGTKRSCVMDWYWSTLPWIKWRKDLFGTAISLGYNAKHYCFDPFKQNNAIFSWSTVLSTSVTRTGSYIVLSDITRPRNALKLRINDIFGPKNFFLSSLMRFTAELPCKC